MDVVLVHEQTVSKYVEVNTIGYGAELTDADSVAKPDTDPEEEAELVADAKEELDEDEHAVEYSN